MKANKDLDKLLLKKKKKPATKSILLYFKGMTNIAVYLPSICALKHHAAYLCSESASLCLLQWPCAAQSTFFSLSAADVESTSSWVWHSQILPLNHIKLERYWSTPFTHLNNRAGL